MEPLLSAFVVGAKLHLKELLEGLVSIHQVDTQKELLQAVG
jgi:hypothetical protein